MLVLACILLLLVEVRAEHREHSARFLRGGRSWPMPVSRAAQAMEAHEYASSVGLVPRASTAANKNGRLEVKPRHAADCQWGSD
jgi:hypothetical protein